MIWNWGTPLTLETPGYVLQTIDPDRLPEEMVEWFRDPEVMRYMNDPMNQSLEQLKNRFSRVDNKSLFAFVIWAREEQKPIGLFRFYIEKANSKAETSILIGDKDYWGKNVVLEVRARLLRFLFTALKLNKVSGSVRGRNFPALFNYTKQGFKKEGVLRKQVRNHQGAFDDVVVFGLLREEWLKMQDETSPSKRENNE